MPMSPQLNRDNFHSEEFSKKLHWGKLKIQGGDDRAEFLLLVLESWSSMLSRSNTCSSEISFNPPDYIWYIVSVVLFRVLVFRVVLFFFFHACSICLLSIRRFFFITSTGLLLASVFASHVMSFVKCTLACLRLLRLTALALSGRAAKKELWLEGKSEAGESDARQQSEVVAVWNVVFEGCCVWGRLASATFFKVK